MARKPRISGAIFAVMKASEQHAWTLDALQAALGEIGAVADFSSIFRAAEKLAADGSLVKVQLEDGRARFELAASHHDHLLCTACDELVPVPCVIGHADVAALEAETGVSVRTHRVILTGLCRSCRADGADGEGGS